MLESGVYGTARVQSAIRPLASRVNVKAAGAARAGTTLRGAGGAAGALRKNEERIIQIQYRHYRALHYCNRTDDTDRYIHWSAHEARKRLVYEAGSSLQVRGSLRS